MVLVTGNAAGQLAPLTLVFSYKRIPEVIIDSIIIGVSVILTVAE